MSTPQDVTGIPQPKEELKRPCTKRHCDGEMTGQREHYMVGTRRTDYTVWTCQKCHSIEI